MIAWSALLLMGSSAANAVPVCPYSPDETQHLSDVCAPYLEGAESYSVTMRASLNPRPAAQQVLIYRMGDQWFLRLAGYQWKPGGSAVETRRNELEISDADASRIVNLMSDAVIDDLSKRPYYGSKDVICMDGASYELASAKEGFRRSARQHSCAGRTPMNAIAGEFHRMAVKYDKKADGMLSALRARD